MSLSIPTTSASSCHAVTPFPARTTKEASTGIVERNRMESDAMESYRRPGASMSSSSKPVEFVYNADGTPLVDQNGNTVTVDKILATKPLRHELSSRPGPGNRKLTYLSGEGVTRTLNDIFGYDGWTLDIKSTNREECIKDDKERFHVAYTSTVRLTLRKSGTYKEDCGAGDAIDRSLGTAVANALKASITDAMKRAARHFGDKLGNSLYNGNFNMSKAPNSLQQALDQYDIERANTKFGFPKDRKQTHAETTPAAPKPNPKIQNAPPPSAIKTTPSTNRSNVDKGPSLIQQSAAANMSSRASVQPTFPSTSTAKRSTHSSIANNAERTQKANQQQTNNTGSTMKPSTVRPLSRSASVPPLTAIQQLEKSSLFGGDLSMFAAGSRASQNTNPLTGKIQQPVDDSNMDLFDIPRPRTSTGLKSNGGGGGSLLGKRPSASLNNENVPPNDPKKQINVNPYLNPSL